MYSTIIYLRGAIVAVYNLSNETKKEKSKRDTNKTIGITLIVIASVAFFALLTSFIGFLRSFLLGSFGLFSYPLFIVIFVIGIALVNNKKYVMTTRYIVYLVGVIMSVLCILHLLTISTEGNFFDYLGRCYSQKMTAGGILCGILTAPIVFILNKAGAYIIFSLALVIFGALLADYIYYLKRTQILKNPIVINKLKNDEPALVVAQPKQEKKTKEEPQKEPKEPINVVYGGQVTNEPEEDAAKRKLGLLKSNIEEKQDTNQQDEKLSESKIDFSDKQAVRNYILSKSNDSKVDMGKYAGQGLYNSTIQRRIDEVKNTNTQTDDKKPSPIIVIHDDSANKEQTNQAEDDSKRIGIAPIVSQPENTEVPEEKPKPEEKLFDNGEDDFTKKLGNLLKKTKLENENKQTTIDQFTEQNEQIQEEQQKTESKTIISKPEPVKEEPKTEQEPIVVAKVPEPPKPKKKIRYITPTLDLLTTMSKDLSELNDDVSKKSAQLENALDTFGIPAKVINVVVGPAVTRYELEMPVGISVKKVLAHQDDIALHLASSGGIRIEAPIPGKSAVGIEVPNESIATVGLRDMISSMEFQTAENPLTFVLGKDISGAVRLCNLAKMPHLLVAGSTGSGKSVCMNAIILSIIYKTSPDDVRFILIDPKQVEFSIYNGLPHLLIPKVVTDSEKALNALSWAVDEMERRYTLFLNSRTKDISEYNKTSDVLEGNVDKMPYIVVMIDEVADLLMTSKKEVEEKIARLAQKSRAAGIHLVLATQRPSVDVITGTMKNNFPSRISFKLMSFADSKTILDQAGAEKLLGKGDMLYKPSDLGEPKRIQGCFVTSGEIANIVDYVKEKNSEYDYDSNVETQIMNPPKQDVMSAANGEPPPDTGYDPLMPQALKCVIENGQASISMLQRRLVIGYPRAARIIDQMQDNNFISASEGSKPRTVLITMEQYEELFGDEQWQKKNY